MFKLFSKFEKTKEKSVPSPNRRAPSRLLLLPPLDARATHPKQSSFPMDAALAAALIALIGCGIVITYSASVVEATVRFHDPQYFLKRHVIYALVGIALIFGVSRFDYHWLYKWTYPMLVGDVGLLILCIIGFGRTAGRGSARWLNVGPIHIQPTEISKLVLVLWLAYSLAKKAERVRSFSIGFLPHLIVAGFLIALCMKQPDFGSSVVLLLLTFTLLFVAGAKVGYLLGASLLGACLGVLAIRLKDYRYERYLAWINMLEHKRDLAYQPFQSVMSFGSGGFWGLGLGRGFQTLYLPEAHTDFVAAILGEELGFLGILILCMTYTLVVVRGVRIALLAPDDYGSYLAFGIATMFGVQALVNLAVALALLPTKGLALPFISFGGSSLLVNSSGAGILLNISRQIVDRNRRGT
ncbi:putative lipid II flippase FtsW [Pajaroellobacter abortibovis]|nr:putative lipid II flippase FtsW [Pajaroellobacter abortibovis]